MAVIELENITKSYGSFGALRGVNLTVREGEVTYGDLDRVLETRGVVLESDEHGEDDLVVLDRGHLPIGE